MQVLIDIQVPNHTEIGVLTIRVVMVCWQIESYSIILYDFSQSRDEYDDHQSFPVNTCSLRCGFDGIPKEHQVYYLREVNATLASSHCVSKPTSKEGLMS